MACKPGIATKKCSNFSIFMILQRTIARYYQKDLTIWLNPNFINEYVGKNVWKYPNSSNYWMKLVRNFHGKAPHSITKFSPFRVYSFFIPNIHYKKPVPVNSLYKYKKIYDLFQHRDDYTKSLWYQNYYNILKTKGNIKYKKIFISSEHELHEFFINYALRLINSMLLEGYINKNPQDIGTVFIGPTGEIHKSNAGDHRFITAKIVGIKSMPFFVKGLHNDFLIENRIINHKDSIPEIIETVHILAENYQ